MAGWITHMHIADEVLKSLPELDRVSFCMGSIAPDCNVENEDWTAFTPSREVTHWMTGEKKLSADCEGFYARYLQDPSLSCEERSFYWGYLAHLMTDVSFFRFIHSPQRTAACWQRICAVPALRRQTHGQPQTWESLKQIFGKQRVFAGMLAMENEYLYTHPETTYLTVLQTVRDFPDYLDYLPKGAIIRKIGVMGGVPARHAGNIDQLFFTRKETDSYIADTCAAIIARIRQA